MQSPLSHGTRPPFLALCTRAILLKIYVMKKSIPKVLFALVGVLLIASGIQPEDHFTWALEVSWVGAGMMILGVYHHKNGAITWFLGMSLFLHALILIYGGWYTYEKVPLGNWIQEWFQFDRNHYDRIGHFAQGFFPAMLAREVLIQNKVVPRRGWREFMVFALMMAFTALFEILEFGAAKAFGDGADAYLGSQGDIWDAQWDMVMCCLGCVVNISLFARRHEGRIECLHQQENQTLIH
ncbi:MAG TPA: DUF2238 domain-containing protein [Verrucomicrobiales bacterium]|nr:hypothetical protein [Pedosphaera sp.]HAO66464.1 DUF2238 domain-containing protein [Verrucomicrobiales bacterium]